VIGTTNRSDEQKFGEFDELLFKGGDESLALADTTFFDKSAGASTVCTSYNESDDADFSREIDPDNLGDEILSPTETTKLTFNLHIQALPFIESGRD
jgi:hypothetical protein